MSVRIDCVEASRVVREIGRRPRLVAAYRDYWEKLAPVTGPDYMDRWLFAVTSYLNTWQNNVKSFRRLQGLGYPLARLGPAGVEAAVVASGAGLHARRAATLYEVDSGYWADPSWWWPAAGEALDDFRRRLVNRVSGMGLAKTAFVIEMLLPSSCEVVCVDRHVLDLYGVPRSRLDDSTYRRVESHWVGCCRAAGVPAPLARHIMWDQKRHPVQWSTRYWSAVLERPALSAVGHYDVSTVRYRRPLFPADEAGRPLFSRGKDKGRTVT